jgi:hypothetical protein
MVLEPPNNSGHQSNTCTNILSWAVQIKRGISLSGVGISSRWRPEAFTLKGQFYSHHDCQLFACQEWTTDWQITLIIESGLPNDA